MSAGPVDTEQAEAMVCPLPSVHLQALLCGSHFIISAPGRWRHPGIPPASPSGQRLSEWRTRRDHWGHRRTTTLQSDSPNCPHTARPQEDQVRDPKLSFPRASWPAHPHLQLQLPPLKRDAERGRARSQCLGHSAHSTAAPKSQVSR